MNSINVGQILTDLQPIALALLSVAGTIFVGLITRGVQKYVGYTITSGQQADFQAAIDKFAAMEFAKATGSLANVSIPLASPLVQQVAGAAMTELPELVAKFKITPTQASQLAQAAIGRLQASSTTVATSPVGTSSALDQGAATVTGMAGATTKIGTIS